MYIQVRLLKGYKEPLLYTVPHQLQDALACGSLVKVPLRAQTVIAYVEHIIHTKPAVAYAIKSIISLEQLPHDPHYQDYIQWLSTYYQIDPLHFLQRIRHFLLQKEEHDRGLKDQIQNVDTKEVQLTQAQHNVVSYMINACNKKEYTPVLLHGVTGSGKTEVYKKIIDHVIKSNKTVILLLPEVTLAQQFMHLLKAQLDPSYAIVSFHSATRPKDKKMAWATLFTGAPQLIIGVHLPMLLPIPNLGLIIIDEEHDAGYQEKKHPKINSKEAALWRAQRAQIPVLLGSATPSVSSLYNVTQRGWSFFELKERFKGVFPAIKIVKLNDKKDRKQFWISTALEQAIKKQLLKKEQTLIFLNRRGFCFFIQCKECSYVTNCSSCSVSLTLHDTNMLICHYCGYTTNHPLICKQCGSKEFLKKGLGTQQVVSILQKLFPQASIARADLDATINKKTWQKTIDAFTQGSIDILIGTQTITKGYHFPKVSLVGVLWADLNLHFPIYNAAEIALQQLIQVAGRAGREGLESVVIIQTMADHAIFSYLNEIDYRDFYTYELEQRIVTGYPPVQRLAELELKNNDENSLEEEAQAIADSLNDFIRGRHLAVTLLGPTKPPVAKLKNWHMRKLYLKSSSINNLINLFKTIDHKKYTSAIFFNPAPLN